MEKKERRMPARMVIDSLTGSIEGSLFFCMLPFAYHYP